MDGWTITALVVGGALAFVAALFAIEAVVCPRRPPADDLER